MIDPKNVTREELERYIEGHSLTDNQKRELRLNNSLRNHPGKESITWHVSPMGRAFRSIGGQSYD